MRSTDAHDVVLYWENIATTRRYVKYTSEIEKRIILNARFLALKQTTALDIGCEGGRWSKLLEDAGWRLICTDVSQRALNICKKRIPNAICVLSSPNDSQFPCETESIGLALCIEVPEVINADWFFDETFRVLQKGGLVVGVFFNRLSWRGLVHHFLAFLKRRSAYVYRFSYPEWRKRLRKRGFFVVYEEGFGWSPVSKTSNSLLVPVVSSIERNLGLRKIVSLSPMVIFIAQKE